MPDGSKPGDQKPALVTRACDQAEVRLLRGDDGIVRLTLSISSERPVDRWFGEEVLSHEAGCIRLERAKNGSMPLLVNHNFDDPIGMIDECRIVDRKLVCEAHLFQTPRAAEVERWIDGGLRNTSLMYQLHVIEEDVKTGRYTAIDWEPYEGSIVTVPADPTVGVGRSADSNNFAVRIVRAASNVSKVAMSAKQETKMGDETNTPAGTATGVETRVLAGQQHELPRQTAEQMDQDRIKGIRNMCRVNGIDAGIENTWITAGTSVLNVTEEMLRIMKTRGESNPKSDAQLDLTPRQAEQFSLRRAIKACAEQNWNGAGFEAECSRAIGAKLGRVQDNNRFFVPYEVQQRQQGSAVEVLARLMMKRDLTAGVSSAGGFLVESANWSFIELMRNLTVLYMMGVTRLAGLQGNISVPKHITPATAYWLGNEATQITESQQAFTQINMSPKTVGGYVEVSKQLLAQSSPSAEALLMSDLALVLAIEIDRVGLNGSGVQGQPVGILQTSGIGSVTGTAMDYADIIEFQTDCASNNTLFENSGYITTPPVAGLFKQRVKFANTASPIWTGGLVMGECDGYRAVATNNMPTATMLFGDYSKTIIGEWGVLEIEVNPFANFQAGIIGVRAWSMIDVMVRYATAYSAAASVT